MGPCTLSSPVSSSGSAVVPGCLQVEDPQRGDFPWLGHQHLAQRQGSGQLLGRHRGPQRPEVGESGVESSGGRDRAWWRTTFDGRATPETPDLGGLRSHRSLIDSIDGVRLSSESLVDQRPNLVARYRIRVAPGPFDLSDLVQHPTMSLGPSTPCRCRTRRQTRQRRALGGVAGRHTHTITVPSAGCLRIGRRVDPAGRSRRIPFGPAPGLRSRTQHSTTLTASPPRAVSLYLTFMSRPVSRIVLMALSSDT